MKILDILKDDIRKQAKHNTAETISPSCILWPDGDSLWHSALPLLKQSMPELYELGDYQPDHRQGPAIWLRCVVANLIDSHSNHHNIPILYLPKISRKDIRADGNMDCRPLVPLQYLAKFWSHENGRDYTPSAFFKAKIGWNFKTDELTKKLIKLSLPQLLESEADVLSNRDINADDIIRLVLGNDLDRLMLEWISDDSSFKGKMGALWNVWCEASKCIYHLDPQAEGILTGCVRLAEHKENCWESVYNKYCQHPDDFPGVMDNLYKTNPKKTIFWNNEDHIGWPQWNDEQENLLRESLVSLCSKTLSEIYQLIPALEMAHKHRANSVWSRLNQTPLANALGILVELIRNTIASKIQLSNFDAIAKQYTEHDYRIDDLVLQLLSIPFSARDRKVIGNLLDVIYLPWLESSAHHLQQLCMNNEYPAKHDTKPRKFEPNTCIMFVDGLRLDVAKRLSTTLTESGHTVKETTKWAPIPTITATGKVSVSPVSHEFIGSLDNTDFSPVYAQNHKSTDLSRVLREHHWQRIYDDTEEMVDFAWFEFGNIDKEGHEKGARLSECIDSFVESIQKQINRLSDIGYHHIYVVTDHGWLLYPGGLPKAELPQMLTESKWGRCAILKDGANVPVNCFPWYWNPCRKIAIANDICCYRKGLEYAHGGISLQECLTLELYISSNKPSDTPQVRFDSIHWKNLRCNIIYDGDTENLSLDIRTQPSDPSTSIVARVKTVSNGGGFVIVKDEDFIGMTAYIVILYSNGQIAAQSETVVGG